MSSNAENLMEEWKSLRDEISSKQEFAGRLVLTAVAGNLAIYSFAFSWKDLAPMNAFVALLPIFLTTMSYFWILRDLHSALRIILYIRIKIESQKIGLGWETWVWAYRTQKHAVKGDGQEERALEGEIEREGGIRWWEDVYGLFYHFFLVVSLLVCIGLIWVPHWPYGSNAVQSSTETAQLSTVPPTVCLWLTLGALLFWILWYFLADELLISQRKNKIEALNKEFQD